MQGVKDLESLKKYGLSESDISELKGIKKDGNKEIKKVRVSSSVKYYQIGLNERSL